MKRFFSTITLLASTCISLIGTEQKPNIVIYLSDDHGVHECSPYGETEARTPFMATLAREGMRFNKAYIASPACGPSRAALFSGLMPARNGAEGNHMAPKPETQTMVGHLQKAGYQVAAIGKVGHGKHVQLSTFDFVKIGSKGSLTRDVRNYLVSRTPGKPLCLLVGDRRPHVAWTKEMDNDPTKLKLPDYLIDTPETREHWARYLTDVNGMDAGMGKIDQLVREHFGSEDYISIYSSDHGAQWPFGKWNLYDAGARVPFLVRWPGQIQAGSTTEAMVSWIDIFPTLIDLIGGEVPDDIDGRSFANVLRGKKADHRELLFTTHTNDKKMNVFPIRAVRDQRYKYIRNLYPDYYHSNHSDIHRKDGAGAYWHSWDEKAKTDPEAEALIQRYYQRPPEEFFDLVNDPHEKTNLINDPQHADTISRLSAELDAWMKEQGDTARMFAEPYPLSGPTPFEMGVDN
ncbi:MAG: sulfatase [Verrucomicrobiota bacterium]